MVTTTIDLLHVIRLQLDMQGTFATLIALDLIVASQRQQSGTLHAGNSAEQPTSCIPNWRISSFIVVHVATVLKHVLLKN